MKSRGSRGFTLLEVLIGMAMLSLLTLALGSSLYSAAHTQERVDARAQSAEDLRLAARFLQDVLAQASLRPVARAGSGDRSTAFFDGQPQAVEWLGVLPARYGLGGRHFLRLALEHDGHGQGELVLRYLPWQEEPFAPNWANAPRQVLAAPVSAMQLRYQSGEDGQWLDQWPPPDRPSGEPRIPAAVALAVDGPAPAWPLLAVAMRAPIVSDQAAANVGFGGGRRRR